VCSDSRPKSRLRGVGSGRHEGRLRFEVSRRPTSYRAEKSQSLDALAARSTAQSPGAMPLRSLQTIDGLGPTASNTVVLALPADVRESLSTLKDAFGGQGSTDSSTSPPA